MPRKCSCGHVFEILPADAVYFNGEDMRGWYWTHRECRTTLFLEGLVWRQEPPVADEPTEPCECEGPESRKSDELGWNVCALCERKWFVEPTRRLA